MNSDIVSLRKISPLVIDFRTCVVKSMLLTVNYGSYLPFDAGHYDCSG